MTAPELEQVLRNLGDTPDAVADTLRSHQIRGLPHQPCGCALAVYLADVHHLVHPVVNGERAHGGIVGQSVMAWLPEPVAGFVGRFDNGHYPDLELEEGA